MAYQTILTAYGLAQAAEAAIGGQPLNLTHMAAGDGNGNDYTPVESQTALAREITSTRQTVNRLYQDPTLKNKYTAELIIPASLGGFTVREVGIYDSNGGLFAIANVPATYKPADTEGAFSDAIIRLEFVVSNADIVNVLIDPNIAVASQQWVLANITAALLIPGGTTGQVLTKETNADGDYIWQEPDVANVVVDVIEEQQTLVASQTVVILGVTTTRGLAVYIEGVRIRRGTDVDEWQPDATTPQTKIVLGRSYPAGTKIIATQNEPNATAPFPLERQKNLSDLENKQTARDNLDVFNRAETRQMAQAGLVAAYARSTAPLGWLKANGAAISRTAYADLFSAIGTTFGVGNGSTTFNLPDLRGEFIRGWDDGRNADTNRVFASSQADANKNHSHTASSSSAGDHGHSAGSADAGQHTHNATTSDAGQHKHSTQLADAITSGEQNTISAGGGLIGLYDGQSMQEAGSHNHLITVQNAGNHNHAITVQNAGTHAHTITVNATGDTESRPRNIALLYCIKY